ncbi:MAG: hypothetical protein U0U70_09485 [Chitinophagaceae bacterium]
MKHLCLLIAAGLLFGGCSKKDSSGNNNNNPNQVTDGTPVPAPTPVSTTLYGMAKVGGTTNTFATGSFWTGEIWTTPQIYPISSGIFNTGKTNFDVYSTVLSYEASNSSTQGHYRTCNRILTLTNSPINYVYFSDIKRLSHGTLLNSAGGSLSLSSYGSLSLGVNSVFELPLGSIPGFFSPNIQAGIFSAYLNPQLPDFGLQVPCSFADINQKRVFLKSFGAISLEGVSLSHTNNEYLGFHNNATGTLTLSIPAGLVASAPDSIEKWAFVSGRWLSKGYAKKVSNSYVAQIDNFTTWNFAKPVKGAYRTIHLRTDSGAVVVNATVRIKSNAGYLGESQTDPDGNAVCFLPANEDMTVEVLNRWSFADYQSVFYSGSIPASNTAATVDITVNAGLPNIITLKGKALNCDGTNITDGLVKMKNQQLTAAPPVYFSVNGGNYNAAQVYSHQGSSSANYNISAINSATNVQGVDTSVVINEGRVNVNNINTCPLDPNLFINFSIDNTPYSITGNYATPYAPYLIVLPGNNNSMLSTAQGSTGLQFSTLAATTGVFTGSGISNLYINNTFYQQDVNKPMRVEFTRYDILSPGIVAGTADFWYKDNANVSHHLVATFRLKRV